MPHQINQEAAWDAEYRNPRMLAPSNLPSAVVVRFIRTLKKEGKRAGNPIDLDGWKILDLGSGTGRNSFYLAQQGAEVTGFEISDTALELARKFARHAELPITYVKQDIGARYPLTDASVDLVLDVTSSNSLSERSRGVYLAEVARILKPGGHFFVRALSLDGDPHAKTLLREHPGFDKGTYVLPGLDVVERVFSEQEFRGLYGAHFQIHSLVRTYHYASVSGRRFKRAYWLAHMTKAH